MSQSNLPTQNRNILSRIFVSSDKPRLRAGWRVLIQFVLYLFLGIVFFLLSETIGDSGSISSIPGRIFDLLAVTGSVYIARRWLDGQSFESLGLSISRQTLIDLTAGIGITFVQFILIFGTMFTMGWINFEGFAWQFDPVNTVISGVLTFFIVFIFVGWNEELLSRGYQLQNIASGTNLFWGTVISSVIFGVLHLGNPNATWVSVAGIFFAGIYLAYGYIRTKQLWLPIGLHIGWNFFEGVVFGFPVSGLDIYTLTRIEITGPELWTGGSFGPEAGLIILPFLAVGALLIFWFTRNRLPYQT